jgi:hypothetical protein
VLRKPMQVRPADHRPVALARTTANAGHPLLELQRTAGNAAVTLLVQRDAAAGDTATRTSVTATFDGLGAVPVASFSFNRPTPGAGNAQGGRGEAPQSREVNLTVPVGPYSPVLMRAASEGTRFATVAIKAPGLSSTLSEVYVTASIAGGSPAGPGSMYLTLNAAKLESS